MPCGDSLPAFALQLPPQESWLLPTRPRSAFVLPARGGSRVIPAEAGIQRLSVVAVSRCERQWISAFAGMTIKKIRGMTTK
jgi:hypothetical protein